MPKSRRRAPALMLIIVCPIIAQPPIPPKNPHTMLAAPCARHSRFGRPRVPVMSSTRFSVSNVSINPTPARMNAYGTMIFSVARFHGTSAM